MHSHNVPALSLLTDEELLATGGEWQPANGMQWLGAQLHHAYNHVCAAVDDYMTRVGQQALENPYYSPVV
jgi:hypothetical protein